ncbi:MAG: Xylose isomerase-like barrel [Planctomycetaceae bacterium]|nr:Xylose isomerase-like barrel [Planctomycetaceae bacterium]
MFELASRRDFLKHSARFAAGIGLAGLFTKSAFAAEEPLYKISLAQWSLHRTINSKKLDNLDFAKVAKTDYGIEAIEYVNQFFKDKAKDEKYLGEMKQRATDHGVKSLLIMIDGEGALGDADEAKRKQAVENHFKWVEAAAFLGCHTIRVNAQSSGSYEEQVGRAADGLRKLSEFGDKHKINVIVENHGGLSSNGGWLSTVIKKVDHPRCGTLPDFGNFRVSKDEMYDRYKGVTELMPFAKAVSAKSHDFDDKGNETQTDYLRMMKIVLDAGYHGYVGIEYEGGKIDESQGIKLTKALLVRVRDELSKKK